MEIFGVPSHILIIHAAVVLTPLAALAAASYALRPSWRYLLRWPTAILAVTSLVSIWAARISGNEFAEQGFELIIKEHERRGEALSLVAIVFTLVVLAACRWLGGPSGFISGAGARETASSPGLSRALAVAVLLASVAVLIGVVLTGHEGAEVTWQFAAELPRATLG